MAERKQNRVRKDGIVNAIKKGEYDDALMEFQEAIKYRQESLKSKVLEMVREIYGEGYQVVPVGQNPNTSVPIVSSSGPLVSEGAAPDPLGDDPVPQNNEGVKEDDMESRSPLIGPFNPS